MARNKILDVLIDPVRCKGCEICVDSCPSGVLEMKEQKAVVVDLPACIGCDLCELRCPDFAVEVVHDKKEE